MSDGDLKFKHRFSCLVDVTSGSGKMTFCILLLQRLDPLCNEREFGCGIIWCYSEYTAVPKSQRLPANTIYHEGVCLLNVLYDNIKLSDCNTRKLMQ